MTSLRMDEALTALRGEIAEHLANQAYIIWKGAGYPTPAAIADAIRAGEFVELAHAMEAIGDIVDGLTARYLASQSEQAYACGFSEVEPMKRGSRR